MTRLAAVLLVLLGAAVACPAQSAPSAIFSFGDSLSDVGNDLATFGLPTAPYYSGRFSNGPNWLDDLASAYGLAQLLPSTAGGTDYAFGGARSGLPNPLIPAPDPKTAIIPTTLSQVAFYLLEHRRGVSATALYTVWSGANDIIAATNDYISQGGDPTTLSAGIDEAAAYEVEAIKDLVKAGAQNLIVVGNPDIGATPAFRGTAAASFATSITLRYNSKISQATAGQPGIRYIDLFELVDNAVADPGAYGFANATTACYPGFGAGPGPLCSPDRTVQDSYLFWDNVHPTEAGHAIFAGLVLQDPTVVPEPASALLLLAAAATTILPRRRNCPMLA